MHDDYIHQITSNLFRKCVIMVFIVDLVILIIFKVYSHVETNYDYTATVYYADTDESITYKSCDIKDILVDNKGMTEIFLKDGSHIYVSNEYVVIKKSLIKK